MKQDSEVDLRAEGELEERWALRAMADASAIEKRHVVLVASQQEGASREAMDWAERIAQAAGLRVRVAYFPQAEPAVSDAPCEAAVEQGVDGILREAAQPGVELVVAGALPAFCGATQAALAQALLRRCARPMLFVGHGSSSPLVMAATDCSDPALPVLRSAWQMAAALGSQIMLVHNIDETGSQLAERIGMPLSPELADVLAVRSREWLESAAAISDVVITRERNNAEGVLSAADQLKAGLLVVGIKPADQAPHGTALPILLRAQRSVLFVPIGRSRHDSSVPGEPPQV
ncbi:MAG: universal stress protein [Myxococcales bacterium]|nr:universal stress protein [Myxococcales bacterium]